jgi:hypothetical protein
MKRWGLAVLIVWLMPVAGEWPRAQVDKAAVGTLFIHTTDGARNVTIIRNGSAMAAFTLPKGTIMTAADEHRSPRHLGGGRYEFHGHFELRAMPPSDMAAPAGSGAMAAAELLRDALMVITAHGLDVILEMAAAP